MLASNAGSYAQPRSMRSGNTPSNEGVVKMTLTANVGTFDRIVRLFLGLALIAYAIPIGFPYTGWNWIGWIGIVPLLTAIFRFCPAYSLLGVSSRAADA